MCRLDQNYVIKVADFGLSVNTYAKSYFRREQTDGVKLPIKWMAYESLTDGIFSEKTDVVSLIHCTTTHIRTKGSKSRKKVIKAKEH